MGIKKGLTFVVRPFFQGNIFNSKSLYNMLKNRVMHASYCFLYVKDTNLKANHNPTCCADITRSTVSCMSKILI